MAWFTYSDMHSGGGCKTDWEIIFVEATSQSEADERFEARTDRSPYYETCECCGNDYALYDNETLAAATAFHRGYGPSSKDTALVLRADGREWSGVCSQLPTEES